MNPTLLNKVLPKLDRDYQFKDKGEYLQQGICPACSKKELYTFAKSPWVLRCGRLEKCGAEYHIKDLYDDLFTNWSESHPVTPENPNASAEAYLSEGRGFDLAKIAGFFTQETFHDSKKNISTATVRFTLPNGAIWERLIDRPERFGKQKANFKGKYTGYAWVPTGVNFATTKEVWIVEGIFDAIALMHKGITAISAMSCVNYPEHTLNALLAQYKGKDDRPKLVWALDDGAAGSKYIKKFVDQSREAGWIARAAQIKSKRGAKLDWNDLHQRGRLDQKALEDALYNGALLIAKSASDKGLLIYNKTERKSFDFAFNNRTYWFELHIEKYHKVRNKLIEQIENEGKEVNEEEVTQQALAESKTIYQIANCYPQALYFQQNTVTDESWYYVRIDFPHDGQSVKNTFTGAQISGAGDFKKRLLSIAPGAIFSGDAKHLDNIIDHQLYGIKTVQTIDYIGYSREHQAYVFDKIAASKNRVFALNDEDYFDIGKQSIKSLNRSIALDINSDLSQFKTDWVQLLWDYQKEKAIITLAFWFGSLFAEQIRKAQKSYPFLEVVGEAGAGKTTLIEFLWKLLGRGEYEGFDPSKSTAAARSRNLSVVGNMPVVLIESDRGDDKGHAKNFDWDELKTAYNGRSTRSRGVKNNGNETYEPPFRGAVVISQNAPVAASEAILSRIVHVYVDKSNHTPKGKAAGDRLASMEIESISGFLVKAITHEDKILETFTKQTKHYQKIIGEMREIKQVRIIENHAQIMALLDCLALIVPVTEQMIEACRDEICEMAKARQMALEADHPDVQTFWETYDYLCGEDDGRLNHTASKGEIAVNLNQIMEYAANKKQQLPHIGDLKKLLKTSRKRKFIEANRTISSVANREFNRDVVSSVDKRPSTVRCWIFKT